MLTVDQLIAIIALCLLVSLFASKLASRLGIPGLLLFLAIGMLAGVEGPGRLPFDNAWLAQAAGVAALVLILFSGGLDTNLSDIKSVLWRGLGLATLGVLITAGSVGLFAYYALGFTLYEGILLGAIIASTDAAAVLTLLRGRGLNLRAGLKPLLEFESGSNDPMAVFLTLGMIALIQDPTRSPLTLALFFAHQMAVGAAVGAALGWGTRWLINRAHLDFEGLYPVLTLTAALLTYGLSALLGGNGFLAVYLAALILSSGPFVHRRTLMQFHDGLAWLMQILMFIVLGLLVTPSRVWAVAPQGLITAAFLIFVARPLAVFLLMRPTGLSWRKSLFVAWVGLRGAAPIVLATFPLLAGLPGSETIFNLVFFIVLSSVLLQGALLAPVANALKLTTPSPPPVNSPLREILADGHILDNLAEITLTPDHIIVGRTVIELGLPPNVLIAMIGRDDQIIAPSGNTALHPGDVLLVVTSHATRQQTYTLLNATRPTSALQTTAPPGD